MFLKILITIICLAFATLNFYLAFWNLFQFHQKTNPKAITSKSYFSRTFPYYSLIVLSVWIFVNYFNILIAAIL